MNTNKLFLLLGLAATGLPAQNILNNGSFVSGLMCWGEWVVSSTFTDGAGDYRFLVSNDTRPGSPDADSIEINCEGSDCFKGYIYTDVIPAPSASQSYRLSYWAKCPAGGTVYVSPPGNPVQPAAGNPEIFGYALCNGNWNLNQISFSSADPAFNPANNAGAPFVNFALNVFQTPWAIFDDVTLTYSDGTAPSHVVLHPGTRNVQISGNSMSVDGAPFLSLGFFAVPYADLATVAATGANTINGVGVGYNSADCFNSGQKSYMDQAYELGLNFVPDSTTTARLANTSVMATARQTFAPHLANVSWTPAGEPDLYSWPFFVISPANLIADYTVAKAQSPLPLSPYFQRAAYDASAIPPYNGAEDIWMAEPYGANFTSTSFAINLFNSIQTRPIWLAQDDIGNTTIPKAYFAVIEGVTGIHYWNWSTFKADPVGLAAATQVFGELNGLKNAIFGAPVDGLVTAPSGIATMSRLDAATGNTYILSVNSATSVVTGTFAVQGLAAGQTVTVLYEGRSITAGAGSFKDTFAGVSRHVYVFHTGVASLTAILGQTSGPAASRDWAVRVYDTGNGAANAAQISGMTLVQTGGTHCTPTIAPGTFPVALGSISPLHSVMSDVIINFSGCTITSKFTVSLTVSANAGAASATIVRDDQRM